MSEANPEPTTPKTAFRDHGDEIDPRHPLRRPRKALPFAKSSNAKFSTAAPSEDPFLRNQPDPQVGELPFWQVDPHPHQAIAYVGPDRRRQRTPQQSSRAHPSRRRTDALYRHGNALSTPARSSRSASTHRPTTSQPRIAAIPSSKSPTSPTSPPSLHPAAGEESPEPPDRTHQGSLSERSTSVKAPNPAPRAAFASVRQVVASQQGSNAHDHPNRVDLASPRSALGSQSLSASKALFQRIRKRSWILPVAALGLVGLLGLGLAKCSSANGSGADKPTMSTTAETVGSGTTPADQAKIIQRTVVGGRDAIGNGSIMADSITQTPRGAAVFADGRTLISDTTSARIIGRDGRIRAVADPSGLLQEPGAAIAFGADIVIIDHASASLVRVKADGSLARVSTDQQFRAPTGIASLDNQTLVVADPGAGTLFLVNVNSDSQLALATPITVSPAFVRPTAVAHRGNQVLAVVDDADGAIYELFQGTRRKIAQARSVRAGVTEPLSGTPGTLEYTAEPLSDPESSGPTTASTTNPARQTATELASGTTTRAPLTDTVLTLPEPIVALSARPDGALWVLGRSSTLTLIATNQGSSSRPEGQLVSQAVNWPQGLGVDAKGRALIADTGAHKVSTIDEKGVLSYVVGAQHSPAYDANTTTADDLVLQSVSSFATTNTGDLYVGDASANTVWGITAGGASYRVVGNGTRSAGSDGALGPDTPIVAPTSLATAPDASTYIAEPATGRIRKIDEQGIVTTVFDQFGGPIAAPEVKPSVPSLGEATIDPAATALVPTTTAAPLAPEVLQERRRKANLGVGRLGLLGVTKDGTLVAVDTWTSKLGIVRDGVFFPKEALRSQPVGLSISTQGDQQSIAVSERGSVEIFRGDVSGDGPLTRKVVEPTMSTASESGTSFGGIVSTENGAFSVLTGVALNPDADPNLQTVFPGTQTEPPRSNNVKPSGPPVLGALGYFPTGEFVQFSANGALFAQFPPLTVSGSATSQTPDSTNTPTSNTSNTSTNSSTPPSSTASTATTASSQGPASTATTAPPLPVVRWLTNPPRATQAVGAGRAPIQDPGAIASQADGTLVFAENGTGKIRLLRNGNLTILAGSGRRSPAETHTDATTATFDHVGSLAPHANGALDFSTLDGFTGIDTVGLVRRIANQDLARAPMTVGPNDETVLVNKRTGLLQRITRSGGFEDLPGTRLVDATQLIAVGDRYYVLSGPVAARIVTVRRGSAEATIPLPNDTVPLAITADANGLLYVLDTQHRLIRLSQKAQSNAPLPPEQLDDWEVLDTTALQFGDERYVNRPDTSDPQAMAVVGEGAIAISDAGTDTIRVVRFPQ